MAEQGHDEELRAEVRRLTHRLDETTRQLGSLRIHLTSWVAAALLFAALVVPAYSEGTEEDFDGPVAAGDEIALFTLAGEAGDVDNGAVRFLAIGTGVVAILAILLTALATFDRRPAVAWSQGALAGLLLAIWFALTIAVGSSEDEGVIDELGFEGTVWTLLMPAGAVMALVASRVSMRVRE